jgi:putative phosphoesterase
LHIIGVISDTHGLLRDEALEVLQGSVLILHAGDVGPPEILERLRDIAPVRAVRGNTDRGAFGETLPIRDVVPLGPAGGAAESPLAYIVHDIEDLDVDPAAAGFRVVVYGHSHRPALQERNGVLYFNPGAAGHRRFHLPVTVGQLLVDAHGAITPRVIDLEAS